jgi:hypothetical protein
MTTHNGRWEIGDRVVDEQCGHEFVVAKPWQEGCPKSACRVRNRHRERAASLTASMAELLEVADAAADLVAADELEPHSALLAVLRLAPAGAFEVAA